MNRLPREKQTQIVNVLCQGMSLRAITRLLNVHRTTTMNLLVETGDYCRELLDASMQNLDCKELQLDEIWTFCTKKQGRLNPEEKRDRNKGDQFLFYAIDPDTKLVPAWALGKRDGSTTMDFVLKLKGSLNGCRPQISSDAFNMYPYVIRATRSARTLTMGR